MILAINAMWRNQVLRKVAHDSSTARNRNTNITLHSTSKFQLNYFNIFNLLCLIQTIATRIVYSLVGIFQLTKIISFQIYKFMKVIVI